MRPPLPALRSSLRDALGGLPRAYWALWVGLLVNRVGSFVVPFLSLYLTQQRRYSVAEAGGLVSLWGLGAIGAGPVSGVISDRIGRRAAIFLSLIGGAALTMALGFVASPVLVGPLVFGVGFVGEIYRPASHAVLADVVPIGDRVRAFNLLSWAINLGVAIGLVLAGLLATVSYTLLFVGDGLTSLAFAWVVWRFVPETRPASHPETVREVLHGLVRPLRDRVFLPFLLLHVVLATVFFQFQLALPVDMAEHGVSPTGYGFLMALNGALIVVVQPFASRFISAWDPGRVMAAGCALIGIGFGLNAVHHSVGWYALGIVVWTLGEIAYLPVISTIPADLAPPSVRGRYQGAYSLAWSVAAFVAPILGAWGLARYGPRGVWGACLLAGLAVAAGQLAIAPARARRLAEIQGAR
ncbi:MAG TPA: MFS transporter [Anaeromyxobacteraceae bacterium]|nr:MFS transporter [Anaeromyxobacteraceae bacterium]